MINREKYKVYDQWHGCVGNIDSLANTWETKLTCLHTRLTSKFWKWEICLILWISTLNSDRPWLLFSIASDTDFQR